MTEKRLECYTYHIIQAIRQVTPLSALYEYKTAPVSVQQGSVYLSNLPHLHKEIEIVYVRRGNTMALADSESYHMTAGDLFISFCDQIHYYPQCEAGEYDVFIVAPKIFYGIREQLTDHVPQSNVISLAAGDPLLDIIEAIRKNPTKDISGYAGYFNLLMSGLLSRLTLRPIIKSENATMHSIMSFCSTHFAEDISLEYLADSLHLSRCYISRLFSRSLNIGFSEYINMLRVTAACDLLLETHDKIADISEEVGFGSIRSFNRAFLKIMGCTPKEYRKKVKKK